MGIDTNVNILYSTNCPKCKQLERHLERSGVKYTISDNIDVVIEQGIRTAPVLNTFDGQWLIFEKAWKWVSEQRKKEDN